MPKLGAPFPEQDAPNYDPENPFADKVARQDHIRYEVGQQYINVARGRIIREKLKECFATHGVNHYTKCKDLREAYLEATLKVKPGWMDMRVWKRREAED
eukprot:TRINITY_DN6355_c0_g1_i1.p5 TRINITY_DN6355_c0_g1~~TRINITY_DN6355_c0_g1_i1.p5  ORF type:complete len:100 (+),score=11.53 TRINITY_DN6355_c0_g1_i1:147-446(+)